MRRDTNDRMEYRVRFAGRPDLDSASFTAEREYEVGDLLAEPGTFEHGDWRIRDIDLGGEGEPDSLVLEPA